MLDRCPVRAALGAAAFAVALGSTGTARAAGALFAHQAATPATIEVTKITAVVAPDPDSSALELHVQVAFEIDQAELLAWVVPTPTAAAIGPGSQQLLANLDAATLPSWRTTIVPAQCADAGAMVAPSSPPPPDDPTPSSMARNLRLPAVAAAGPLAAATDAIDWLLERGYLVSDGANALLGSYGAAGWSAAILEVPVEPGPNLTFPVSLRLPDGALTLPTALAALNAGVGAPLELYVLADGRGAPGNADHVVLNPLRIDWLTLGDNYDALVDEALDDPAIDGEGMVTDAVVPALDVRRQGLTDPRWDTAAFITLPANGVPNALIDQGLYECPEAGTCTPQHPLIERIVANFFLGNDLTLGRYRACPPCFEDTVVWQPREFAAAFLALIVEPGIGARTAIDRAATVTRLRAQVSADDPTLEIWADGPLVPARRTAVGIERCDGDLVARLPDGRDLYVPHRGPWPDLGESMPAIERIEDVHNEGNPTVVLDHRDRIDEMLREHNDAHGWPVRGLLACSVTAADEAGRGARWWLLALPWVMRRRPRRGARRHRNRRSLGAKWLAPIVAVLGLLGCRPAPARPAEHPTAAADIEAALARNAQALRDAGIGVPAPTPQVPQAFPDAGDEARLEPPADPTPVPDSIPDDSPKKTTHEEAPFDVAEDEEEDAPELSARRDEREPSVDQEVAAAPASRSVRYRSRGRRSRRRARAQERRDDAARCDRICELADATCALASHICRLAQTHPDDPRYRESCGRAAQQCDAAQTACDRCR